MAQNLRLEYTRYARRTGRGAKLLSLRKQLGGGSKWRTYAVLFLILGGVLLAFYFKIRQEVPDRYRPYLYGGTFLLFLFFFFKNRVAWKSSSGTTIEVSESGLNIIAATAKTTIPWPAFSDCLESPKVFALLDKPKGFLIVIPKRAFPGEEWQNWFRTLAQHRPAPEELPQAETPDATRSISGDQITLKFKLGFGIIWIALWLRGRPGESSPP